jgi:hypothetical protein
MTRRNITRRNIATTDDSGTSDNNPGPRDMDAFRWGLIRRISDIRDEWRSCDEPECRRARACVAKSLACSSRPPPPSTPAQRERALARFYHALQARRAEAEQALDAEEAAAKERTAAAEAASRSTTRRSGGRGRR